MKLENQVCSLEYAKKLKELGVKQEGFWSWYCDEERDDIDTLNRTEEEYVVGGVGYYTNKYSAFTPAELFEKLPKGFFLGKDDGYYCGCSVEYIEDINPEFSKKLDEKFYGWLEDFAQEQTEDNNPANCLAKMLIYLKENKLI